MPAKLDIYKCAKCGNVVEFLTDRSCTPECCAEPMQHMKEGAVDAAREKHVPVISKIEGGYKVTVGSAAHPMTEAHLIEWIELITDTDTFTHFLKPEEAPEAVFCTTAEKVTARAYCNLHGLWKAEL
ncbi:MAG: desulfoferrodoxin [Desulfovibrionaceae bacterium]|nr:desulfoferrodoxin [Desulfovibrionaceae bacterium]